MSQSAITLKRRDVRTREDRLRELEADYERLPNGPAGFKARQVAQADIVTARIALNTAKEELQQLLDKSAGIQVSLL